MPFVAKDIWKEYLSHIKKESESWRLYELAYRNDIEELKKSNVSAIINQKAKYTNFNNVPNHFCLLKEKMKEYHTALSCLWGEWHLQLVRKAFMTRNYSDTNMFSALVDFSMHMKSMRLLRQGRLKLSIKVTLLVIAICMEHEDMVGFLIKNGAKIDLYEIVLSIRIGNISIFTTLIQNYKNAASIEYFSQKVSSILKWSFIPKKVDFERNSLRILNSVFLNWSVLNFCFQWNKKEVIFYIFQKYAVSMDQICVESMFQCCDIEIIKFILELFPKLAHDPIDNNLTTKYPLHIVASHLRKDAALLLIDLNVNVNALDGDQKSPLHLCITSICKYSRTHIPKATLNSKANLFLPIIVNLVRRGADLNKTDSIGNFPLQVLISQWYGQDGETSWLPWLVQVLISAGANVNQKCKFDDTLVHLAAKQRIYTVAKVLVDNGAIITTNKQHRIPGDLCRDYVLKPMFLRLKTLVPSLHAISIASLAKKGPLPKTYRDRIHALKIQFD